MITDANASFCKLFGYNRDEMIGKDMRELYFDPSDRPKFQEEIEKKGFVKDYEVKFRKSDGTEVDCLLTSSVHFGQDGSIVGYRGILRDLTLRKALQKQFLHAQKMEAIGTLAGGMAHDFNNLLQAVLGYADLLLMKKGPGDPDRKKLEVIQHAARDGADLVSRILTFSRKGESRARPVDLNEEIRKAQRLLRRTIPRMIQIDLCSRKTSGSSMPTLPKWNRSYLIWPSTPNMRCLMGDDCSSRRATCLSVMNTCGLTWVPTGQLRPLHRLGYRGWYESGVMDRIFEPFFTTKTNG